MDVRLFLLYNSIPNLYSCVLFLVLVCQSQVSSLVGATSDTCFVPFILVVFLECKWNIYKHEFDVYTKQFKYNIDILRSDIFLKKNNCKKWNQ